MTAWGTEILFEISQPILLNIRTPDCFIDITEILTKVGHKVSIWNHSMSLVESVDPFQKAITDKFIISGGVYKFYSKWITFETFSSLPHKYLLLFKCWITLQHTRDSLYEIRRCSLWPLRLHTVRPRVLSVLQRCRKGKEWKTMEVIYLETRDKDKSCMYNLFKMTSFRTSLIDLWIPHFWSLSWAFRWFCAGYRLILEYIKWIQVWTIVSRLFRGDETWQLLLGIRPELFEPYALERNVVGRSTLTFSYPTV